MNKKSQRTHSSEEKRRFWEIVAMVVVSFLLVGLSRLESRLFELSKSLSMNAEFFTSIIYFGLINLNVILILSLGFLIFRNVAKLVVDRKRGVLGSKLRTRLVVALAFFAVAPTILMFYVSSRFLTTSFDSWFSVKVRDTIQQTREAGAQVYKQDQRRLESLARIALQKVSVPKHFSRFPGDVPKIDVSQLKGFTKEYHLEGVRVYNGNGTMVWTNLKTPSGPSFDVSFERINEVIQNFIEEPGLVSKGIVEADDNRDVVKGMAPIYDPLTSQLVGVIVTEEHFETQILKSIETILAEFADLRPGAQLIRLSYLIILVVMVFIIVFSATWLGFYVARGIVNPIQTLAEITNEVAAGNYDVELPDKTDDETGALVQAFEKMIIDLRSHEENNAKFTRQLQQSNEELNRRSQYMEVMLKNISAGVISVNPIGAVTSCNSAAERLLGINSSEAIGVPVGIALGEALTEVFWLPVLERINATGTFNGELSLEVADKAQTLFMAGLRIHSESGVDLGIVLVFDDATEQARAQRVAAWREVARRIAHEIKNPITPIKLSAQRLLRRYETKFEGEDKTVFKVCIETILTQVDSLRDLVNEFSKFSRLPAIDLASAQINDIILDVSSLYSMSYPSIEFDTDGLKADLPAVMIDKEQMNRAIVNVVSNSVAAVQQSSDAGKITFKSMVLEHLNVVRVEIIDDGCGISNNEMDRVFQPYYSTKEEGTGLGLPIVSQIISDHGGYIRLVSNEPRGTKVVIDIPLGEKQQLKS